MLALLPLGLRLWPIAHGAPHSYVPDTHMVRNALGMARDKDLVPAVGEHSTYPYLGAYLLLPVYAAEFAIGRAAGEWRNTAEFGARLMEEPIRAHLPARVLFATLSAAAALAAFGAARAAGLATGAWFAAWLAGTSLLHVQFSLQERPWALLATLILAAAWPAIVHARSGDRRALLASAALAGLAFAVHQGGLFALALPALALAAAPTHGGAPARASLRSRASLGLRALAVFLLLAVPLGHPYWIAHGFTPPEQVAAHGLGDAQDPSVSIGGQRIVLRMSGTTLVNLSRSFAGYDPAILALALLGFPAALRRRALVPATGFALLWGGFFFTNQNEHVRYVLPFALIACIPAGVAAEALARRGAGRIALAAICALPLVQALRLGWVLRREDTRAEAIERLAALPEGSRVAVDMYGPTPPRNEAALEATAELRELYSREAHRLAAYRGGAEPRGPRGIDALGLEDAFEYDQRAGGSSIRPLARERFGATSQEVLRGLGVTHLLLVDRFPGDGRPPPLVDPTPAVSIAGNPPPPKLAPLALSGAPEWVIDPGSPGTSRDAHLPTELDFPLMDLWRVSRPGPRLELWPLPRE